MAEYVWDLAAAYFRLSERVATLENQLSERRRDHQEMIHLLPPQRFVVATTGSETCHVCGAQAVLEDLESDEYEFFCARHDPRTPEQRARDEWWDRDDGR